MTKPPTHRVEIPHWMHSMIVQANIRSGASGRSVTDTVHRAITEHLVREALVHHEPQGNDMWETYKDLLEQHKQRMAIDEHDHVWERRT